MGVISISVNSRIERSGKRQLSLNLRIITSNRGDKLLISKQRNQFFRGINFFSYSRDPQNIRTDDVELQRSM